MDASKKGTWPELQYLVVALNLQIGKAHLILLPWKDLEGINRLWSPL